ncbi:MAG: Thymidylate kinase [Planctomycetota bacterium]|jgi:dTMP kinase
MRKGFFVSFDGLDGCGKSTQVKLLASNLASRGMKTTTCIDPGGTELGKILREILLHHKSQIATRCEALLFMASRAQLVDQVVLPALDRGEVVISDRYLFANVVYQGYGGGLNPDELWQAGILSTNGILPDVTFLLDLPVSVSRQRVGKPSDRMEQRSDEYFENVRKGFLKEASIGRQNIKVIDAELSEKIVGELVLSEVDELIRKRVS